MTVNLNRALVVGVDFGTLSGRAVVVSTALGLGVTALVMQRLLK